MYSAKSADDDATAKASPGGPARASEGQPPYGKDAADDATVRISPGGPPPTTKDSKGILKPAQWTLSPGQSLVISVGKGLSLNLSMGMNSTGCVIKTERK